MPRAELPLPGGLKKNEEWVSIDADAAPVSIDGASIGFAGRMHDEVSGCWKVRASEPKLRSFYAVPNNCHGQRCKGNASAVKTYLKLFLMGGSLPRLGIHSFL